MLVMEGMEQKLEITRVLHKREREREREREIHICICIYIGRKRQRQRAIHNASSDFLVWTGCQVGQDVED